MVVKPPRCDPTTRWARGAFALLTAVLLVAGCGGPSPRADAAGSLEAGLGYTAERMSALQERHDQAVEFCMRNAGFSWAASAPDPLVTVSPHGLFSLETPQALRAYRLERGYGIAQQFWALQEAERQFLAGDPHVRYLNALDGEQRAAYLQALEGPPGRPAGCAAEAAAAHGGLDLVEGGALGRDYGEALARMNQSSAGRKIARGVVACLRGRGHDVDALDSVQTPFVERLVALTGAEVSRDRNGRLSYRFGALREGGAPVRVRDSDLDALLRDERKTGRDEVECRDRFAAEQDRLLGEYTADLLRKHATAVERLRQDLATVAER